MFTEVTMYFRRMLCPQTLALNIHPTFSRSNLHNDLLTTPMASDSSVYPLSHVLSGAAAHRRSNSEMSPAQKIAEAWARESAESQNRWKAADARTKEKYYAPQPWLSSQVWSSLRAKM
ncbi:hypothetical protein BC835DRAFT_579808 [Cytidiella melzeri]|nr:hypothetical protein BC835DRAFT_579808 [Cytidiella melzeri]